MPRPRLSDADLDAFMRRVISNGGEVQAGPLGQRLGYARGSMSTRLRALKWTAVVDHADTAWHPPKATP